MDCAIISRRGGGGGWGLRNGKEVVKNRALPPNPRRKTKYEPSFIQKINETPPKHTHTPNPLCGKNRNESQKDNSKDCGVKFSHFSFTTSLSTYSRAFCCLSSSFNIFKLFLLSNPANLKHKINSSALQKVFDWLTKLAPLSQPMKSKTKTCSHAFSRAFCYVGYTHLLRLLIGSLLWSRLP